MSLRAFLARLIWACVIPLVALAAFLAYDSVRTVRAHQDQEAANAARNVAATIDQGLAARIGGLQILAASPLADDPARWNEFYIEALGFRESFGTHVILADLDPRMRVNTRLALGSALPTLPRPQGRAAVPIAIKTGKPAIGDVFVSPITREPLVAIAAPGVRSGRVGFVLLTILETFMLQAPLDLAALPPGWGLTLRDGIGVPIARRGGWVGPLDASRPPRRFVAATALSPWSVELEIPAEADDAPLRSAAVALALGILAATLASLLGGLRAGRRLARSVASLAAAGAPEASAGITEISQVRALLDEAARRREAAESAVRAVNADLESRVAARTAELENANRELQAFDYSVSHDLRAPLNRIHGFGAALVDEYGDRIPAEAVDLVKRIQASGEAMDRIVTDMLALSTIARGEVHRSDVDLSAMARQILESFQRTEPDRRVRIEVAPHIRAEADPGLMRIALENLLANAWRFTSRCAEARIEFHCAREDGATRYIVRDNGAGFDPALAGRLFEPFRRLHSQDDFPGTGIGLATVRRIIRRHGGQTWAHGAVGEGATFVFTVEA